MVRAMWANLEQPTTEKVIAKHKGELLKLSSPTKGASIAYQISDNWACKSAWKIWQVYDKPLKVSEGQIIYTQAIRIGYKPSEISIIKKN